MIGYLGSSTFNANKTSKDNDGRILIIDVEIEDDAFFIINLYNPNTEAEQLQTLSKLDQLLEDFCLDSTQNIIFAEDFNLCFKLMIQSSSGNISLKNKYVSNILQICKKLGLAVIWRIRNLLWKHCTFRKKSFLGFYTKRLRFIFQFKFSTRINQEN